MQIQRFLRGRRAGRRFGRRARKGLTSDIFCPHGKGHCAGKAEKSARAVRNRAGALSGSFNYFEVSCSIGSKFG